MESSYDNDIVIEHERRQRSVHGEASRLHSLTIYYQRTARTLEDHVPSGIAATSPCVELLFEVQDHQLRSPLALTEKLRGNAYHIL